MAQNTGQEPPTTSRASIRARLHVAVSRCAIERMDHEQQGERFEGAVLDTWPARLADGYSARPVVAALATVARARAHGVERRS